MDASFHDWLSLGPEHKINLHLAVDDATSHLLGGYLYPTETIIGYYQVLHQVLVEYGVPVDLYTDRRSVFKYNSKRAIESEHIQFKNACNALGIGIIPTSIAQAKGRVERSFRTHQDRLVSELRLAGITTINEANEYLAGYMKRHNTKYALDVPVDRRGEPMSVFRPLGDQADLNRILAVVEQRKVLNGNLISFKGKQYYIVKDDSSRLLLPVNTPVETVKTLDGQLLIKYDDIYYKAIYFADGRLTAHTPPATHPWRRAPYGRNLGRK
jgi:hypothetical protein